MSRRRVCWSDLPSELITPIANRLETRPDILNFRAACNEWRRSTPLKLLSDKTILSTILPHRLLTESPPLLKGGAFLHEENFTCDLLSSSDLMLVTSSIFVVKPVFNPELPPWLVTVEEVHPGKLFLRKPLCRTAIANVANGFPKLLDLSQFEVAEMGKVYSLRADDEYNHLFEEEHKVLLIDAKCESKDRPSIDDCTVVVLYDSGVLSVIRLKDEVEKPAFVKARKFDDIVVFKGVVYTIDRYGKLYWMDYSNDELKKVRMVNVVDKALHSGNERKNRLVESCGELYLVRKCFVSRPSLPRKRTTGIRVYKLNQVNNAWDELDSIGDDRILFVTPDCGFFANVSDFVGWKGNCIVHCGRDSFPSNGVSCSSYIRLGDHYYNKCVAYRDGDKLDLEVFHIQECKFEPVESNPSHSVVFGPPPRWLSPSICSPERPKMEPLEGTFEQIETAAAQFERHNDSEYSSDEEVDWVWSNYLVVPWF